MQWIIFLHFIKWYFRWRGNYFSIAQYRILSHNTVQSAHCALVEKTLCVWKRVVDEKTDADAKAISQTVPRLCTEEIQSKPKLRKRSKANSQLFLSPSTF